jgi:hypothetical protein
VDAYGDGEALASVRAKAEAAGLALTFHAKRDHLDASLADYQARALHAPPLPCSPAAVPVHESCLTALVI